jgi:hypothetical protein
MSTEKPVILGKRKVIDIVSENPLTCIVHCGHGYDTSIQPVTANQFRIIREAVTVRQTQNDLANRLDEICVLVPNEADSSVHGIHIPHSDNLQAQIINTM